MAARAWNRLAAWGSLAVFALACDPATVDSENDFLNGAPTTSGGGMSAATPGAGGGANTTGAPAAGTGGTSGSTGSVITSNHGEY